MAGGQDMRLVKDAKRAWRWFSVQANAVSIAVGAAWLVVPDDMRSAVPADWLAICAVTLAALGTIGRLVDQDDA